MATGAGVTKSYTGQLAISGSLASAETGDLTGGEVGAISFAQAWAAVGGSAPTTQGGWHSVLTLAAGANDLLLANAVAPCTGVQYPAGFSPAGLRLKALVLINLDATASIDVQEGAANGAPVFKGASQGVTLPPAAVAGQQGGALALYWGDQGAGNTVLTSGANDKLTLTPSAGTPQAEVFALYG